MEFKLYFDFFCIVSYNQPKICVNATWNKNGITFANQSTVGEKPRGIFVDYNDTIYVADYTKGRILVWFKDSTSPVRELTVSLYERTSLFVTMNGDIYFENRNQAGRIEKWPLNSVRSVFVTQFPTHCYGLFIDIHNTLYCSLHKQRQVVSIPLDGNSTMMTIVAGSGSAGSESNELNEPRGIFVDANTNLYVADALNNRIQLFPRGKSNGITVAGNGVPNGLNLVYPTDVILDIDGFLYIADNQKHRIIRSGHTGFECIVGCTGKNGSASNELNIVYALRFDSYGNLYVADEFNHRIQKFNLVTNSCGKFNRKLEMTL
jgi:hypothetical protein